MEEHAITRSRIESFGALALSRARHVFSALTWDNPLAWPRFHGRHPLADLEGPEYLLFAPFREVDLASPEELAAGTPLELSGRVYDRATGHPVGDAVLDLWQASPRTGRYSGSDYALRGRIRAGADGRYRVRTVLPPPLSMRVVSRMDRALFGLPHKAIERLAGEPMRFERPAHIHVIVRALGYRPLTTQLYFAHAEERAPNDPANVVRRWREVLELEPAPADGEQSRVASFDFAIDRRAGALREPERRPSPGARPKVRRVPAPPRDEREITARPKGTARAAGGVIPEEGLAIGPDERGRKTLSDATHQGNFESIVEEQGLAAEDPTRTDEIAAGAPLEGDESAWEASVSRALEEQEGEEDEEL